jgi:hypothetical protein
MKRQLFTTLLLSLIVGVGGYSLYDPEAGKAIVQGVVIGLFYGVIYTFLLVGIALPGIMTASISSLLREILFREVYRFRPSLKRVLQAGMLEVVVTSVFLIRPEPAYCVLILAVLMATHWRLTDPTKSLNGRFFRSLGFSTITLVISVGLHQTLFQNYIK